MYLVRVKGGLRGGSAPRPAAASQGRKLEQAEVTSLVIHESYAVQSTASQLINTSPVFNDACDAAQFAVKGVERFEREDGVRSS